MVPPQNHARVLWQYALLSYLLLLVNAASYLRGIEYTGRITPFFVGAVYLTYSLLYILPMFVLLIVLDLIASAGPVSRLLSRARIGPSGLIRALAVIGMTLVQVIIFADGWFIYRIFDFHINGYVWNLVTTRGGIESMGGSTSTNVSFALIIAGLLAIQAALMVLLVRVRRLRGILDRTTTPRGVIITVVLVLILGGFERITYGLCSLRGYSPVLVASNAFPFYQPTGFRSLALSLGYKIDRQPTVNVSLGSGALHYPLHPIRRQPPAKPYNIVFLVAESWRADMLDPEIMPQTWALARKSNWFKHHYAGGNGTRMAMFSLFYGLYGCYWFNFLEQNRGPVLMDVLIDANYQMSMYTSAKFTYPEFDRTIFARIPRNRLREGESHPKWRRDRENVDLLLKFIDERDPSRPFMTFLFFESAHANYYFPKECIIRTPYTEDLNYATMNLQKDIPLIKNRYVNACRHLDTQFDRILKYLADHNLTDSTIVLITGDHGEEFMEKGHWGHASTFNEFQTRVPMVLWVPGNPRKEVAHMTCHMDVPATLMPLLGVTNPPSDYSLGFDMLGDKVRDYVVMAEWDRVAFVDQQFKAVFPVGAYDFSRVKITTKNDEPIDKPAEFFEKNRQRVVDVMRQMKVFNRPQRS